MFWCFVDMCYVLVFVDMCYLLVFCWHVLCFGVLLTCAIFCCFVDMCYVLVFCWHVLSFAVLLTRAIFWCTLYDTIYPRPFAQYMCHTSSIFRHALFQIVHKLLLQRFDDALITFIRQENLFSSACSNIELVQLQTTTTMTLKSYSKCAVYLQKCDIICLSIQQKYEY